MAAVKLEWDQDIALMSGSFDWANGTVRVQPELSGPKMSKQPQSVGYHQQARSHVGEHGHP